MSDETMSWSTLGNGTLIHVQSDSSAGLILAAAWERSDHSWELAVSVGGGGFVGEATFDSFDPIPDHVEDLIERLDDPDPIQASPPFDFDFASDEDGELWMISNDPISEAAEVTVLSHRPDGSEDRQTKAGGGNSLGFPSRNYEIPVSAWCVGRDYCELQIRVTDADVYTYGSCDHQETHRQRR